VPLSSDSIYLWKNKTKWLEGYNWLEQSWRTTLLKHIIVVAVVGVVAVVAYVDVISINVVFIVVVVNADIELASVCDYSTIT
jgi:hypothetical protein